MLKAPSTLTLARRRAHLRHKSGGAAVFIVAITLGVLAVMGVYALTATAADVRSAGHVREAMQAQRAAEFAMMATAETYTAAIGGVLIKKSRSYDVVNGRSTTCKSAKPPTANKIYQDAEACLSLTEEQMSTIAASVNQMKQPSQIIAGCTTPANCNLFWGNGAVPGSFGPTPNRPFLHVEVTNPIDVPPPPGMSLDGSWTFTQVTASVYVDMKQNKTDPASTTTLARGRLTVGPYAR